ncbi:MAG: phosphoribosylanthranilate isomerase [Patescibacteria group bacterium]|jgi:phosphoribosylanthranilate isomerase
MKIKFCGITNIEDAKNAINLGADYLGFIIDFPQSPRSITLEQFMALSAKVQNCDSGILSEANQIPNSQPRRQAGKFQIPKIVAVTVDMAENKLNKFLDSNLIDILQFHGNETPELCGRFKNRAEVWRLFKISPDDNLEKTISDLKRFKGKIDRFLIDSASADDKAKGAAKKFDNFSLFKNFEQAGYPLVLAGGINPDNVKLYIEKLNPEIIDVASGIEDRPGKKSLKKMKELIKIVNKYNRKKAN